MTEDTETERLEVFGALIGMVVGVVVSVSFMVLQWSETLAIPIGFPYNILVMVLIIVVFVTVCYYTPNKWGI